MWLKPVQEIYIISQLKQTAINAVRWLIVELIVSLAVGFSQLIKRINSLIGFSQNTTNKKAKPLASLYYFQNFCFIQTSYQCFGCYHRPFLLRCRFLRLLCQSHHLDHLLGRIFLLYRQIYRLVNSWYHTVVGQYLLF